MSEKKKKRASSSRLSTLVEDIKVEHEIPVLERIKYPIIWERTTSGYRIQDLQLSKVDHAIDIIKEHYITEETLCRGVNLVGSNEAVDEYLTSVTNWLKDTQSLAAVEEGTGTIVGLLIGRVLDRTVRTQIRLTMVKHPKLMAIQKIKSYLTSRTDILSLYDVDFYYSIYVLLVTPQHRGKGIAKSLVRCAIDMSRKFECDVVAGIFTSKISQNIAHKEGFKLHEEVQLSQWVVNNEEVLTDVEDSDTAAVMVYRIEEPEPLPQPPPVQAPRRSAKIVKIHSTPH